MKYSILSRLCLLFTITTTTTTLVLAQQQQCQGIEILYPKTDSVIDQTEDQSTSYLILGNTVKASSLKKVLVLHEKEGKEVQEQVWIGQDDLLKVTAIQQDLSKLEVNNDYWFRVLVQQDNHECLFDSGKFKVVKL
ncbi:hypothetical protein HPULCUR_011296 [Helicostylum pulchrum]|uniref:Uncharacterized protein n=1 Tax=Helicostylum pulchrum TaxID=562976 RepID=A0ABP9YFP2_9FUNG